MFDGYVTKQSIEEIVIVDKTTAGVSTVMRDQIKPGGLCLLQDGFVVHWMLIQKEFEQVFIWPLYNVNLLLRPPQATRRSDLPLVANADEIMVELLCTLKNSRSVRTLIFLQCIASRE